MENLPEDLLITVFKLFSPLERLELSFVCKAWRDSLIKAWSDVKFLDDPVTPKQLIILLPHCGKFLRSINCSAEGDDCFSLEKLLWHIGPCSKNLTKLQVDDFEIADPHAFLLALQFFKNLEILSVTLPKRQRPDLVFSENSFTNMPFLPKLDKLRFTIQQREYRPDWRQFLLFIDKGFFPCLERCPTEVHLSCFAEREVTNPYFGVFRIRGLLENKDYSTLKRLVVRGSDFSKFDVDDMRFLCERAQGLEVFDTNCHLSAIATATNEIPTDLSFLGYLRNLRILQFCFKSTDDCHITDSDLAVISLNCKNLEILKLRQSGYLNSITDVGILSLRSLSQLKELYLATASEIHDWSLATTVMQLSELRKVFLCYCLKLNGSFLHMAVKLCPNLNEVCVSGCSLVDNSAIQLMLPALHNRREAGNEEILTIHAHITEISMAEIIADDQFHNLPLNFDFDQGGCRSAHDSGETTPS